MSVRRSPRNVPLRSGFDPRGIALLLALSAVAGCNSGGSGTGSVVSCAGGNTTAMCLDNCNLGCSSTGCAQTDIAQNQIVILNFNDEVDVNTVNSTSIRFRTGSGDQPVGEFLVTGNRVEFVPTLSISGGQTFFGFSAGETYTMTIPGGNTQNGVLRSTSGKPFGKTLTCTLRASLGIIDLNGVPPRATLTVPPPERVTSAPLDTLIVLEFNEMIDATPFLGGTQTPVTFTVRRNRETTGGGWECNPNSAQQPLTGTQSLDFDAGRGISVLTFHPVQALPGNVCVEINVTDGVADLSGRPAQPQTLTFLTEVVPLTDHSIVEEFDNADKLDADASGATVSGGSVHFASIGGDGRHGVFDPTVLTSVPPVISPIDGKTVYTVNTDAVITIPASHTTTGAPIAITDGRFYFESMIVPSNVRMRFVGSMPPQFTVAGRLEVLGHIDVAGLAPSSPLPLQSQLTGQVGGIAGAAGAAGGNGGDKISQLQATTSGVASNNQGRVGGNATLPAGHGYSPSVANTGGRGSTVFPTSGLNANVYYSVVTPNLGYSPSATAGGGGGGCTQAGTNGVVVGNNHPDPGLTNVVATSSSPTFDVITVGSATWIVNRYAARSITFTSGAAATQTRTIASNTANTITVSSAFTADPTGGAFNVTTGPAPNRDVMGPPANGGTALQLFPFPPPSGLQRASLHFLAGGAGGGGAGSTACLSLNLTGDKWVAGCAGGGGGGAVSLRAGNALRIGQAGKVLANGGAALNNNSTIASSSTQPAPGGGGSGGSVVLQSGNITEITGQIDVRGGLGGVFSRFNGTLPGGAPPGASVQINGGNGANGFVRLEEPTLPPLSHLATMLPPATTDNIGALSERDDLVLCTSKYYATGLIFGPEFARYEIYGTVDGNPFVLSDDPTVSTQAAVVGAPVRALWQAAQLDLVTETPQQLGPWRTAVHSTSTQTGIDADGFNGFRYKLLADYALGIVITVERVVVVYRT
jgi:hypothetical protein